MSDSTTTTTAPTTQPKTEPEKPKRTRGTLNRRDEESLLKCEKVGAVAKKYPAPMEGRDISGAFVEEFINRCLGIRAAMAQTLGSTTDTAAAIVTEADLKGAVVGGVREVQAAAKQKYTGRAQAKLKDYYVGESIALNRARLEQVTAGILEKLAPSADSGNAPDVLPGFTPAKIAAFAAARTAYVEAGKTQSDAKTDAASGRIDVTAQLAQLTADRRKIQYAAEAEWPAKNPANAPIRREFQLPADRPFNG